MDVSPLGLFAYVSGILSGFVSSIAHNVYTAARTGDHTPLIQVLVTLLIVYIALLVVAKIVRMLWSTIALIFKLTLLALVVSASVYTYQHGFEHTVATVTSAVEQWYKQVTSGHIKLSSHHIKYANKARNHVASAYANAQAVLNRFTS